MRVGIHSRGAALDLVLADGPDAVQYTRTASWLLHGTTAPILTNQGFPRRRDAAT